MAALILTTAATVAASSLSLNATATAILTATAAVAGRLIDQSLLARPTTAEGPRLDSLDVTSSSEGSPIPRVYGRMRVGGDVIWATQLEEMKKTETSGGGGKGRSRSGSRTTTTTYHYYANFAVALCEGPVSHLGRMWMDGEEVDQDQIDFRFYSGRDSQNPDPLIEAKEGSGTVPAYRGLCYVVFERLPLQDYGNRIPQVAFEVYRAVGGLESKLKAVDIIPGAGEFAYEPGFVQNTFWPATYRSENSTTTRPGSDFAVAIDELQALVPGLQAAALVSTWFGTDLRAGHCRVEPRVDSRTKPSSLEWSVAGLTRETANVVSTYDGGPSFGGTPNDASVIASIQNLKSRGIAVLFYPFIMMDIPEGSGLPDPYGNPEQAAYPWRGRITCDPAIGGPGTADQTALAVSQIAAFVGTATAAHFSVSGGSVTYSGPSEWSFRRHILHSAALCKAAGGVEAFVIGTEMVGLTRVRDHTGGFPFVDALIELAGQVRNLLGPGTKISYAADWSEYHSYRPDDGSGDAYFNLDSLWNSQNIDFIGIDAYFPLTDWRDGFDHLDAVAHPSATGAHDPGLLRAGIEGGEYYDWYYETEADRRAQIRTPITDGANGKPWVYRQKDVKSWWSSWHVNRSAGSEAGAPTEWIPQSKPIWFTEIGCPAVDKGPNQPNVFHDPKSSESFFPHFSNGSRDDHVQRRFLDAVIDYWSPDAGNNPVSVSYGGPMIDPDRFFIWAYDARAFPGFPADIDHWRDAPNWDRGHWLNARLGSAPLDGLVEAILRDADHTAVDVSAVSGHLDGYTLDRPMSVRDALDPLEHAFAIAPQDRDGNLVVGGMAAPTLLTISADDIAILEEGEDDGNGISWVRAEATTVPGTARITLREPFADLDAITVEARHPDGDLRRVSSSVLPGALGPEQARGLAETWLHRAHVRRDRVQFGLPPSLVALEPGDVIALKSEGAEDIVQIEEVTDEIARLVKAVRHDPALRLEAHAERSGRSVTVNTATGVPHLVFLDLPLLRDADPETSLYLAAEADPWREGVAVYLSPEEDGFELATTLEAPSAMGMLSTALLAGPAHRFDRSASVDVAISNAVLASVTDLQLFSGANPFAVRHVSGDWEVFQAGTIELIGSGLYRLSNLLRGQKGTEFLSSDDVPAGAIVVVLDDDIGLIDVGADRVRLPSFWRYGLSGRSFADPSFQTVPHTPAGVGERPYRPVHLSTRETVVGDLIATWIRQTRASGDGWDQDEVPLGETDERYSVDVISGGAIVRTIETTTPSVTYSAALQALDFPGGRPALELNIAQRSARFGAGPAATIAVAA